MTLGSARTPLRSLLLTGLGILAVAPLLLLLITSISRSWFWPALLPVPSADSWAALIAGTSGGRLSGAALNSLALALATGLLASALSLPLGRALAGLRGWRRSLGAGAAFLPVAAPPIALGIGLQFTFLTLGLGGSFMGVLLAHLVPALGYATLYFLGVFAVYDDRLEDEARTLGASPTQVFRRVTLPRLGRPLLEAALLGFLVSWAQVPLTILVGQGLVPTLAVEVLGLVQSGQDALAATGSLLLIIPAIFMLMAAALAIRRVEAVPV
ncbi:MAG: ABC transporter permease subunit [Gemmatimonadota bacterium]